MCIRDSHHIDFMDLTGRTILVYGQQEVVKDLIAARLAAGGSILFEAEAAEVGGIEDGQPVIRFRQEGTPDEVTCDFIAACDGSHGVGRISMQGTSSTYERVYPHAWLGVLERTPPTSEEVIYASHERGFALHSMRSPEISRLYLQVRAGEDMGAWPEGRVWDELRARLGESDLQAGEILDTGITPMRSLVIEPMQRGRLFLAGDAAHVVPPTGAKGMNLALADVRELAAALVEWYACGSRVRLERYSQECLTRVWRAEHFSAFMTGLLHRDADGDPFEHKLRLANLTYITQSRAAATSLAENYTSAASGVGE